MGAEVNTLPDGSNDIVRHDRATIDDAVVVVQGDLRRLRAGWLHLLQLVTGLSLLRWLARCLLSLVGYRHRVTVSLSDAALSVRGERSLMGLTLGPTELAVPLSRVRWVGLAGQSPVWAVVCAVGALLLSAGIGLVLSIWGVSAGQVSWTATGVSVIALGILLDALAYLWVRRAARRGKARLALRHDDRRLVVVGVDLAEATRLVRRSAPLLDGP